MGPGHHSENSHVGPYQLDSVCANRVELSVSTSPHIARLT